ncbi:Kef-type K+ transport system, membrane component KefB [Desulfatibacillum alkenivorans DSM 16219]|jgi:Kef-type K+ transport system membrane component KefB|uniref:Kef-type K+ transport system, membrane component KefB n=1 Tax=Desulfatibacillum alkenivorans DSM 16219 TaxID=1121393 RepID=A0A1M6NQM7_9BACT|nr:cation:proton antiporter [Desulfatibacillum alkenivorans]SHJ97984.1 Kef-type K+ transport system, membrane component KefB [Desulfatibacillum alkenivorans DSM 16219]
MNPNPQLNVKPRWLPISLAIGIMAILGLWYVTYNPEESWQASGSMNFSLGFLMLAGYVGAILFQVMKLPRITGYIFAGILIGPHALGIFTHERIMDLRLVDDLALSFIALTAGGSLELKELSKRFAHIGLTVLFIALIVFCSVAALVSLTGPMFSFTAQLSPREVLAMGLLLGVLAVAISPSSVIAIIAEAKAKGPFTETALGVTVAIDVIVIVLFTIAMAGARALLMSQGADPMVFAVLGGELLISVLLGALLGWGLAYYIKKAGHDLPLVLLLAAFGVARVSAFLSWYIHENYNASVHMEPLLICMAAGFVVANFSDYGRIFVDTLERFSLPVYLLFFCLTGASLDLNALASTWPLALAIGFMRAGGIWMATNLSGLITKSPPLHRKRAFMAFVSQAGVAVGLAGLAQAQFPEIGGYLLPVVLALIAVNQIAGPVLLKLALNQVGETPERK